jgi:hypothetical protein
VPCAIRRLERICRQRSIGLIRKIGTDPPAMSCTTEGKAISGFRASSRSGNTGFERG